MKFEESETLEFKKSTSELKEAVISIGAILNKHQKGKLYFGIKNDGTVIGHGIGKKTLRDISKTISDHIEPKIYPKINKEKIKDKDCVVIEFSGNNIPYYAYGRAYKRVADEDRLMSAKEVEKLILEKNKHKLRWDKEICKEAELSDISARKLKRFLKEASKSFDSVENSLKKLKLIRNDKLLNAAVILFGKNPEKFFPNAKLRCAVFARNDTSYIIDRQEFEGDLLYLIEKAEEYILKNIHIGMKVEGLRRIDLPEINKEAFREAIINAFCHRNYYLYDSVNIAIFKDRLEIRSPGLLFGGLTIEKIKKEQVSERRNELIADMLHEIHLIEKWGRGIKLILSKEPDADFKEVGRQFISIFKRKEVTPQVTPQVKLTEEFLEKAGLNERQRKAVEYLKEKGRITNEEYRILNNTHRVTAFRDLNDLTDKGIIEKIGKTGKYTYYKLKR